MSNIHHLERSLRKLRLTRVGADGMRWKNARWRKAGPRRVIC